MAFRSALSLGLNLRLVDNQTHYTSKEARCRLWWCIFELEHLLTAITGRVSGVGENLSSVPAPLPVDEEQFEHPEVQHLIYDSSLRESCLRMTLFESDGEGKTTAEWLAACAPSPSLYFYVLVDLSMITQGIINRIYSIEGLRGRGSQVEHRIQRFARKLDSWLAKVPPAYRFVDNDGAALDTSQLTASSQPYTRERISLALSYYSARITLCRPCLTSSQGKRQTSPDTQQGQHSNSAPLPPSVFPQSRFRAEKTYACIRAACSLISMLPDSSPDPNIDPQDAIWLTTASPWWCVLHYIMQATTVLLLGISAWPFPKLVVPSTASPLYNNGSTTTTATTTAASTSSNSNGSNSNGSSMADGSFSSNDTNTANPTSTTSSSPSAAAIDLPILLTHARKALKCLRNMAGTSVTSRRAYKLCESFMRRIAPTLDVGAGVDWESVVAMDLPDFDDENEEDGRANHLHQGDGDLDGGGGGGGGGSGSVSGGGRGDTETSLYSELEAMDVAFQQTLASSEG